MISWEILKQFSVVNPPNVRLYREAKIENKYTLHRERIKENYESVAEYLIDKMFSDEACNTRMVFIDNTFPYNTASNIKHMLVWINPKYSENAKEVRTFIKDNTSKPFIYFKNSIQFKTILEVEHYHVFIQCY